MGRPRIKVIDTAIDTKKVEDLKKKELVISKEIEQKIEKQDKTAKRDVKKKDKKLNNRSKHYEYQAQLIDKSKEYPLTEAIDIIKKASDTKFDSSLEIHVNLNTDTSKQEHSVRKSIKLPHSSGQKVRVLVFGGDSKELKSLGVDVGSESTIENINQGKVDVDKVVATPEWMPKLTKVAKVLGPKGLMPNPKSGTITEKPEKIVKDLQGGMVEVKTENSPIIHLIVGKLSFPKEKLEKNINALISEIQKSKPESLKKAMIKSAFISATMSPSIKLDLSNL